MLEVKNLKKSFDNNKVLKGIDFKVNKGDIVAVIGPSGCGKSTFLRCLNMIERPTGGKVIFEGYDLTAGNVNLPKIREKIGMVFQQFNLFPHLTVIQNITLAPIKLGIMSQDDANKRAVELLKTINLLDKKDYYPNELSGGQKQRVAIARALCMKPEVLLFDEPTSALDPISTSKIEDLLMDLKKDYTIVIVTHNMQQASRIADNTAFFLQGEIIETGDTEKIFSFPQDKRTEDYITGRFG